MYIIRLDKIEVFYDLINKYKSKCGLIETVLELNIDQFRIYFTNKLQLLVKNQRDKFTMLKATGGVIALLDGGFVLAFGADYICILTLGVLDTFQDIEDASEKLYFCNYNGAYDIEDDSTVYIALLLINDNNNATYTLIANNCAIITDLMYRLYTTKVAKHIVYACPLLAKYIQTHTLCILLDDNDDKLMFLYNSGVKEWTGDAWGLTVYMFIKDDAGLEN